MTTTTRTLGDAEVFPIGLGAMPLSLDGRPDEDRAIRTIHAALDAGVNLIDTADAYARDERDVGHNERLIAKALRGRRDGVIVATKGGHTRSGRAWELDGRPEHIRAACEASLTALETDVIDLYQFHRPDPDVPYAESIGAFKELQDEGKVRWVGVSNANVEQLEEALAHRRRRERAEPARAGLHLAAAQGRAGRRRPSAGSPSCRGRRWAGSATRTAPATSRRSCGRPSATTSRRSRSCSRGCSRSARRVIPIPGSSRPETIADSARAVELELTADELAAISAAVGV